MDNQDDTTKPEAKAVEIPRPTIEELDLMLASNEPLDIEIQPDGSIRAVPKCTANNASGVGCMDLLGIPSNEGKSGFNAHDKTDGKEEWLTPPEIIKALGDFDLDPCSPTDETRPWPTAKAHYSIVDNGLIKPWQGRVWCNPPYGGETNRWMKRCADHRNVTALIFARTETQQFFESIWPKATAVCFIKGRLSFYHVSGKKGGTAGAPSMLVTWDDNNANLLWDAVLHGRIKGAFVDLRGGRVTP